MSSSFLKKVESFLMFFRCSFVAAFYAPFVLIQQFAGGFPKKFCCKNA